MNNDPYVKMYKVRRGWYVEVGCQAIVFADTPEEREIMVDTFKVFITGGESAARDLLDGDSKYKSEAREELVPVSSMPVDKRAAEGPIRRTNIHREDSGSSQASAQTGSGGY